MFISKMLKYEKSLSYVYRWNTAYWTLVIVMVNFMCQLDGASESRSVMSPSSDRPPGISVHGMNSPGKNTGVGCHALLQGILPTQGSNPGLPHCRQILYHLSYQFSSIHSVVSDSLQPQEPQHARPPCPSPTPGVHPNPCPLSQWYHPTISSPLVPFSSCPQSFPASGSFQMSQLFLPGGQSIGVSASTSVLPMNTQDWSPLGWTGWISLQSKGLSRVFSNTTVQKHQFFGTQLSL